MRFKAMKVRLVLSSLLAVLALGAVTASAAQAATEGPFYKTKGILTETRLASGSSKEVTAKLNQTLQLVFLNNGVKIECSKVGFAAGAKVLGSTGANSAGGEATLEFSGCTVGDNGSQCKVENGVIKTLPLKLELGYMDATRTGDMAVLFKPATGSVVAELKFEHSGSECYYQKGKVTGSFAGNVEVGEKPVEVGKEPAAAKTLQINFPHEYITKVWTEKSGTLESQKVELEGFSSIIAPYGNIGLELAGGTEWGVFT